MDSEGESEKHRCVGEVEAVGDSAEEGRDSRVQYALGSWRVDGHDDEADGSDDDAPFDGHECGEACEMVEEAVAFDVHQRRTEEESGARDPR